MYNPNMLTIPANFPLNRKMRRLASRGKIRIAREGETRGLGADAPRRQEDIIYDAAVLRMASCLEWLLRQKVGKESVLNRNNIEAFRKIASVPRPIYDAMISIADERHKIAHQRNVEHRIDRAKFTDIRTQCLQVEKWVNAALKMETGIRNVMTARPLPYPMGNAGDVIKHGAVAELVAWRIADHPDRPLRYADPFGGRPWEEPRCDKIWRRINAISPSCALRKAQPAPESRIYGSAHAVLNVARAMGGESCVEIYASDSDKFARDDLRASSNAVQLIDVAFDGLGFDNKDGYSVLNMADKFDLILIDPYGKFLKEEFLKKPGKERFDKMLQAIRKNRDLWLAVFVLNLTRGNTVGKGYADFYQRELADCAVGLRCPKIPDSGVEKENDFEETDVLLLSSQVGDGKADELRKRLERFRQSAQDALGVEIAPLNLSA